MHDLFVRNVVGRYPRFGALRSDNIRATVSEVAGVFVVRLDDASRPEMWLEITLELAEASCAPVAGTS